MTEPNSETMTEAEITHLRVLLDDSCSPTCPRREEHARERRLLATVTELMNDKWDDAHSYFAARERELTARLREETERANLWNMENAKGRIALDDLTARLAEVTKERDEARSVISRIGLLLAQFGDFKRIAAAESKRADKLESALSEARAEKGKLADALAEVLASAGILPCALQASMVTPRPLQPWWRRALHEISWRVPHAWRVLIHGDCDGY
jgi:chromosome segregation ATPase